MGVGANVRSEVAACMLVATAGNFAMITEGTGLKSSVVITIRVKVSLTTAHCIGTAMIRHPEHLVQHTKLIDV